MFYILRTGLDHQQCERVKVKSELVTKVCDVLWKCSISFVVGVPTPPKNFHEWPVQKAIPSFLPTLGFRSFKVEVIPTSSSGMWDPKRHTWWIFPNVSSSWIGDSCHKMTKLGKFEDQRGPNWGAQTLRKNLVSPLFFDMKQLCKCHREFDECVFKNECGLVGSADVLKPWMVNLLQVICGLIL